MLPSCNELPAISAGAVHFTRDASRRLPGIGGGLRIGRSVAPDVRQALVAWDGWEVAFRDFTQRESLGLPPHRRAVRLEGLADAIEEAVSAIDGAEATVSRDSQGAWIMASRGAMQGIVGAIRGVAVARSQRSVTPLYIKVDATPNV